MLHFHLDVHEISKIGKSVETIGRRCVEGSWGVTAYGCIVSLKGDESVPNMWNLYNSVNTLKPM
jgi:hypothetical protein